MLELFFENKSKEIRALVNQFIEDDFYVHFPKLRKKVSLIIVGSVATGNYDKLSDIDVEIICSNKKYRDAYRAGIKGYKRHIRNIGEPLQFHKAKTYSEIINNLSDWKNDGALREYSQALVVEDPNGQFKKIQKRFTYYPAVVYKEKVNWLFAETVFQLRERFSVAAKRGDKYFGEVVKVQIIRLLLNAVLMMNEKFPSFDKHVFQDVKKIHETPADLLRNIEDLLTSHQFSVTQPLLGAAVQVVEQALITRGLITKHPDQYWLDLRPKNQVQLG